MFGGTDAGNDFFGVQNSLAKQAFIGRINIGTVNDFNQIFEPNQRSFFEIVKELVNNGFMRNDVFLTRRSNIRT